MQPWEDLAKTKCQQHLLVEIMRIGTGTKDEEDDIACGYLNPFLNRNMAEGGDFHDSVEIGAMDSAPIIRVSDRTG